MNPNARLTLVGAGPGDPELITLKAIRALKEADVVLYDALVNKALLDHAPDAIHQYVGKRKGVHRYKQEEINDLIVEQAQKHGHVVRLKGGDPFVFGRGSEELSHVAQYGIPGKVIPGISSSLAVPALKGIPLTQRGISESFWVITGTTSERQLSKDLRLAVQSSATIVVLMGVHKLPHILAEFLRFDKGDLPAAVIQNGSMPSEKFLRSKVDDLLEAVERTGISSPAVMVFGEVVRSSSRLETVLSSIDYVKAS